jgi:hypothetical protein
MSNVILEDKLKIPLNHLWDEFHKEFYKLKIQKKQKLKVKEEDDKEEDLEKEWIFFLNF